MNLIDSSAWLAYLQDEKNGAFFAAAIEDTELLLVPTICLSEVFKVVLREKGVEAALQTAAAMRQGTIVDLTHDLAVDAAMIAHREKLALADSIIAATAKLFGADIWTQDEHFAALPQVHYRPKAK